MKINKNHITHIELVDLSENEHAKENGQTFVEREGVVICNEDGLTYNFEKEKFLVKNNKLFNKPHICLKLIGEKETRNLFFDTYDECIEFAKKMGYDDSNFIEL